MLSAFLTNPDYARLVHHLPALQIAIPLLAAPLCVLFRGRRLSWWITIITSFICLLIATSLLTLVKDGSVIHYDIGGWAAPSGIEYYVDITDALILLLVSLVSTVVSWYALPTVQQEIPREKHYLFFAGWLLCLTGLLGIAITGDAFNVFVFLEISSLSTYFLIALGTNRPHSFIAAFRYLIMGSIGASFILLGIGFLYAATGTLNMQDLSIRIPEVADSRTVIVSFSFITIGLLIKTAVFPLHAWLPNAYQYSPSAVSSFLAGTATKVSLYMLIRFMYHVFDVDYSFGQMLLGGVLLPAAIIGFLLMSLVAIFQTDIRRLLAYSSIAQIGYIVAAIAMMTHSGLSAALIHIFNHGLIKSALFMATGCMIYRLGHAKIASLPQLFSSMPFTVSAFVFGGISLVGIPLTAGFISKWQLISAAFERDWWWLAVLMLISSIMAVIYIGRVIQVLCLSGHAPQEKTQEVPMIMWIPTWTLLLISLYIGINSTELVNLTERAATQLLTNME